jgi:hypothetical protein
MKMTMVMMAMTSVFPGVATGSTNSSRGRCCHAAGHSAGHSARQALAANSPAIEILPETDGAECFHLLNVGFVYSSVL